MFWPSLCEHRLCSSEKQARIKGWPGSGPHMAVAGWDRAVMRDDSQANKYSLSSCVWPTFRRWNVTWGSGTWRPELRSCCTNTELCRRWTNTFCLGADMRRWGVEAVAQRLRKQASAASNESCVQKSPHWIVNFEVFVLEFPLNGYKFHFFLVRSGTRKSNTQTNNCASSVVKVQQPVPTTK